MPALEQVERLITGREAAGAVLIVRLSAESLLAFAAAGFHRRVSARTSAGGTIASSCVCAGLHAAQVVDLPQVVDVVDDVVEGVSLVSRTASRGVWAITAHVRNVRRRARAGSGPEGAACGDHEHPGMGRAIGELGELPSETAPRR